ncbi:class I SAM-dependent methyltransferase [Clostridium transplantifaecale]|uniref:class I SAM-dependent methyltransferase n=1 Tax=Clostridium transplantifaecale TaxID=2479838 RepID=UPI000F637561|nr:class I SAM-dependent methyltransferase [Clostridium transplantifaecale]
MNSQLKSIAQSYDRAIELGKKGVDLYKNLPEYLKNDPDYSKFQMARECGIDSDSGRIEIRYFLSPAQKMKFVDLGCCLNLMFNGYDQWPSTYYGVDISDETIKLLKQYSQKNNLNVGALHCGSIHKTPFEDNYFEIGACIGVLEYFEKNFVMEALIEAHRILKPRSKFVLDVPDNAGKMRRFMNLIETSMGRPDKFDISIKEFEDILLNLFEVERREEMEAVSMIQYFLKRKA